MSSKVYVELEKGLPTKDDNDNCIESILPLFPVAVNIVSFFTRLFKRLYLR